MEGERLSKSDDEGEDVAAYIPVCDARTRDVAFRFVSRGKALVGLPQVRKRPRYCGNLLSRREFFFVRHDLIEL